MKRRTKLRIWLNIGELLALAPMILGGLPTAVSMIAAFNDISQGRAPEEPLAEAVSLGLYLSMATGPLCPIGLLILVVSVIELRRDDDENNRDAG